MIPGTKLGRYEIRSRLGAGGMGEVYLAEDTLLRRAIALKLLPADVASDRERMRRFQQEARAAAALNHPHIAHVYEIGESDGAHFIAMEYVEGETLRGQMRRHKNDLKVPLKFLLQVAQGLAKAHAAGIVHRDLKPDNVMVTPEGYAKILDFGLAKLVEQTKPESADEMGEAATAVLPAQHSTPGVVMGTVGYMSPEQARGQTVDQRSDIFSFGCILYEAAAGRQAFEGDSVIDTLHKIIYEPAPAISDLNPAAPAELQRIIRKCLAKDPDKRYQSVRDVANDLEELLEELKDEGDLERSVAPPSRATGEAARSTDSGGLTASGTGQVPHQPASSAEYLVTEIKRHRRGVIVAAAALVLALAGAAYLYLASSRKSTIDSIVVLPFANASADPETEYLSDGITESIINGLSHLPKLRVMARSTAFSYKGRAVDPRQVGRELGVDAVLMGKVHQRGETLIIQADLVNVADGSQLWGENYNRKLSDIFAVQEEISREISDKLRLRLTGEEKKQLAKRYTDNIEAYQLYLQGRYHWNRRTEEEFEKAAAYFQQAIDKDPNYALGYAGLADTYALLGNYYLLPPTEAYPRARAAAAKALEIDQTLAEAHTSLAYVRENFEWNWPGAEREFKRAIELNPNYATAHHWYGVYLTYRGRFDEANAEMKRAQELDPLSSIINGNVGYVLYFARQYDQAIAHLRKAIEMDPNFGVNYFRLGQAYNQKGMYEEAIASFQKAISLSGHNAEFAGNLGYVYARSGKRGEAQKVLDELLDLSARRYVSPFDIATVYLGLGEKDQALQWLEKAYRERNAQMNTLKVNPLVDGLRPDPRFQDLMLRVGLAP